jgi:hypothetical protein
MNLPRFDGRISGLCDSRSKRRSIRRVTTARLWALGTAYVPFAPERPDIYRLISIVDAELTKRTPSGELALGRFLTILVGRRIGSRRIYNDLNDAPASFTGSILLSGSERFQFRIRETKVVHQVAAHN